MFSSASETLGPKAARTTAIVASVIALSMVPCVLLLFRGNAIVALAIVVASIVVLYTLVNPIVGVLALFTLGMVGDLQHFENFPSLSVLLIPCVALGFAARLLATKRLPRGQVVMSLVLFVGTYCAGMCMGTRVVGDLAGPAVFAGYAAGFFLVLNLVRTKRKIRMVYIAVGMGAALVSFALITQWLGIETPLTALSRPDLPLSAYEVSKRVERTLGFARDPNAAAYPCIVAAPILLALTATTKRLGGRLALIALFGATVVGLATTQSLSGDLGLAASLAVFILIVGARTRYWILVLLIVLFSLGMTYMPTGDFTTRFASAQSSFEGDRKIQYEVGFALLVQHPVFGAGEDAFIAKMLEQSGLAVIPHSNLLSVLTYSGLVGFLTLLCFTLNYARFLFHHWERVKDRTLKLYAAGAVAALVGFHVQGLFIGNMGWFPIWAMTAIPICAVLANQHGMPDSATTHYAANPVWRRLDCRSEVSAL